MPIYPPRNEPIRKVEILDKRVTDLVKSMRLNDSEEKQKNKAKKVKSAKLNLIKARLALLKSYRQEDEKKSKLDLIKKLENEFIKWELFSFKDIVKIYCGDKDCD